MAIGNHGGSRKGAGRKRKWDSDAQRMRAKRFEKRTQARLYIGGENPRRRPSKAQTHAVYREIYRGRLKVRRGEYPHEPPDPPIIKIRSEPGVTPVPMGSELYEGEDTGVLVGRGKRLSRWVDGHSLMPDGLIWTRQGRRKRGNLRLVAAPHFDARGDGIYPPYQARHLDIRLANESDAVCAVCRKINNLGQRALESAFTVDEQVIIQNLVTRKRPLVGAAQALDLPRVPSSWLRNQPRNQIRYHLIPYYPKRRNEDDPSTDPED